MAQELNDILIRIEELRAKLEQMLNNKDISDPEVAAASKMLDAMLNEYHKILKKSTDLD